MEHYTQDLLDTYTLEEAKQIDTNTQLLIININNQNTYDYDAEKQPGTTLTLDFTTMPVGHSATSPNHFTYWDAPRLGLSKEFTYTPRGDNDFVEDGVPLLINRDKAREQITEMYENYPSYFIDKAMQAAEEGWKILDTQCTQLTQ